MKLPRVVWVVLLALAAFYLGMLAGAARAGCDTQEYDSGPVRRDA